MRVFQNHDIIRNVGEFSCKKKCKPVGYKTCMIKLFHTKFFNKKKLKMENLMTSQSNDIVIGCTMISDASHV